MRNVQSISVTVPTQIVQALDRLQKSEMKSCSAIVSEAIRRYIDAEEYRTLSRDLSTRAKSLGIITEKDIDKAVHESRTIRRSRNAKKTHRS